MALPNGYRGGTRYRSVNGCWTCKLRKKKCDEKYPACVVCSTLRITCCYAEDKPDWFDGGSKQDEMAQKIKREIKTNAPSRRIDRPISASGTHVVGDPDDTLLLSSDPFSVLLQSDVDSSLACKDTSGNVLTMGSDAVLLTFYLEHVFPFLFPFYHPSPFEGGKAWILEMMITRPVVRQATLCQSSYFFSLARGLEDSHVLWETVLAQTGRAFEVLRQALQIIHTSELSQHLPGAVRVFSSIMQIQRFEVAISSFDNCRAHLSAATALFKQLVGRVAEDGMTACSESFNAVLAHLVPLETQSHPGLRVPSAEQAAFRFSTALLIFDDLISSTVLQEPPELYEYYHGLLASNDGSDPPIGLDTIVGCANWVLVQIAEIALLDAWKQRCRRAGELDVMQLVQRATTIKERLMAEMAGDEGIESNDTKWNGALSVLMAHNASRLETSTSQRSQITRIWLHAAFLYLSVVVSGRQPANHEVRHHVHQIIDLLSHEISPLELLRSVGWPFCVAGCLAEPQHEDCFRKMVARLQPASIFPTLYKALEIMENAWRMRDTGTAASGDLASCFKSGGDVVLLV